MRKPASFLILFCVAGAAFIGWHGHGYSELERVHTRLSQVHSELRTLQEAEATLRAHQADARAALAGQLVINEIRRWLRQGAASAAAPLHIESIRQASGASSSAPIGGGMHLDVFLSRDLSAEEEKGLKKHVDEYLSLTFPGAVRQLGLTATNQVFMRYQDKPGTPKFRLEFQLSPTSEFSLAHQLPTP